MKRRQVITAFGTLAIGTGTALGTGAFSATSSSSQASMSIATQSANANLDIDPGDSIDDENNIKSGLYTDPINLNISDLPAAAVADAGQGMVNVQVFGIPDQDETFDGIIKIVNNESTDFDVGFAFTQFGSIPLTRDEVSDVFEFRNHKGEDQTGTNVISNHVTTDDDLDTMGFGSSGLNITPITVPSVGSKHVDLRFNGTDSAVTNNYDEVKAGNFSSSDNAADSNSGLETSNEIVKEVTAVANEA